MSLNRYLKSHTLQFYSVYQSDTTFLIIRGKDNASLRFLQTLHIIFYIYNNKLYPTIKTTIFSSPETNKTGKTKENSRKSQKSPENIWRFKIKCLPLHSHLRNNKCDALVAQLVEHLTLNQRVQGSSPCRRTKRHFFRCLFFVLATN